MKRLLIPLAGLALLSTTAARCQPVPARIARTMVPVIQAAPEQYGFDTPSGTILVTPGCHDLAVTTANWPFGSRVWMEFGSAPPMQPALNSTGAWHFLASSETQPWRVEILDSAGQTIGHVGDFVTGC